MAGATLGKPVETPSLSVKAHGVMMPIIYFLSKT
jgi:hypothetical protein